MKLRALGTGNLFCRWPNIPACWLIQTHDSNVLIGCPPQAPARLEILGIPLNKIGMIVPLGASNMDIGGLDEIGAVFADAADKPYLACPQRLLDKVAERVSYIEGFQKRAVKKINITEEHITEAINFIPNSNGTYGFQLEFARIYCAGHTKVNPEFLSTFDCDLILHKEDPELTELPVYLQNKVWIYGYRSPTEGSDPLPMLFMPQSAFIFDSDRRDKIMVKERYIRENSKRVIGNDAHKP